MLGIKKKMLEEEGCALARTLSQWEIINREVQEEIVEALNKATPGDFELLFDGHDIIIKRKD